MFWNRNNARDSEWYHTMVKRHADLLLQFQLLEGEIKIIKTDVADIYRKFDYRMKAVIKDVKNEEKAPTETNKSENIFLTPDGKLIR